MQRVTGKKLTGTSIIACAGLAGGLAGMLGNPTEVVLVRMCADGVKPPLQRYDYGNAVRGMMRIAIDEGVSTFYRGLIPNVVRSVLMSKSQLNHVGTI